MHEIFTGADAAEELAVILAIVDYKRPKLRRLPSLDYLAHLAGLAPERFSEVLDRLVARGLLERQDDGQKVSVEIAGLLRAIEEATPD